MNTKRQSPNWVRLDHHDYKNLHSILCDLEGELSVSEKQTATKVSEIYAKMIQTHSRLRFKKIAEEKIA